MCNVYKVTVTKVPISTGPGGERLRGPGQDASRNVLADTPNEASDITRAVLESPNLEINIQGVLELGKDVIEASDIPGGTK